MPHRTLLRRIAILTIAIFIPFVSIKSAEPDSSCTALPEEQRFSAGGYELGTCYKDVEELVISKGHTLNDIRPPSEYIQSFLQNYPLISTYRSDFADVVPPLKDKMKDNPTVTLWFYKNTLYSISINLSYQKQIGPEKLKEIHEIIAKKITERIGTPPVLDKNTKELEWNLKNVRVSFDELSKRFTDSFLKETLTGSFSITYEYLPIENQAKQYRAEIDQKIRQEEEENTSGF